MMDDNNVYDDNIGKFTDESVENIIRSINNIVDIDEIVQISLLSATPFTIENFLEIKEKIHTGTFSPSKINYTLQKDILLFYQIVTVTDKYYALAHRDPFEVYFNEVIMWFHELVYTYSSIPEENIIYKKPVAVLSNN